MSLEILNLRFKSDYKMSFYTLGFDVDIIRMKYVLRAATMLEFMLPLP